MVNCGFDHQWSKAKVSSYFHFCNSYHWKLTLATRFIVRSSDLRCGSIFHSFRKTSNRIDLFSSSRIIGLNENKCTAFVLEQQSNSNGYGHFEIRALVERQACSVQIIKKCLSLGEEPVNELFNLDFVLHFVWLIENELEHFERQNKKDRFCYTRKH